MSSGRSSNANSPLSFADKAAETIQKNFRGFKDRLKVREKAAFNIQQLIEYSEEQDHLNLNKFFLRWIQLIKHSDNEEINRYISSSIQDNLTQITEKDILIEPGYTGVHLSNEFNSSDFEKLVNSFRKEKILHSKYALMILNRAIDYLKNLPNINEINCIEDPEPKNGEEFKVNVVGDLHGQFIDLYTIFDLNGLPSKKNVYLFNGDFVDRGAQQCEVLFTLLYGLVLYGGKYNSFFLNRGNHEDYGCSVRFGFKEEVMTKYCLYSKLLMKKCAQVFVLIPLMSMIYQKSNREQISKILVGNN